MFQLSRDILIQIVECSHFFYSTLFFMKKHVGMEWPSRSPDLTPIRFFPLGKCVHQFDYCQEADEHLVSIIIYHFIICIVSMYYF